MSRTVLKELNCVSDELDRAHLLGTEVSAAVIANLRDVVLMLEEGYGAYDDTSEFYEEFVFLEEVPDKSDVQNGSEG